MHWLFLTATMLSIGEGTAAPAGTPLAPHRLEGRVTTSSGQPISDARVLVVELRHSVQTDPDGDGRREDSSRQALSNRV